MKLTSKQNELVKGVAWAMLLDRDFAYVEVGKFKPFARSTVESMVERGMLAKYGGGEPSCPDVYYLVLSGKAASIMTDLVEWQYGECIDYLNEKGLGYETDAPLCKMKSIVFDSKLAV